ncbi:EamA family transporter RarD [Mesobacillus foraminis]|uniref:Chloramphenicol-sensitive protein RarD n=1 Tax=Mesobacillus foraminis TaxID=279826 RepID=A0A4R2BDU3_9BACI|nr:EamA family transporter RarD [Mesobacillus foraminis]MBT2754439.1 EamA family transporter RarD [Mesobacillus foraminis]TCN24422.1 chloramphenicol-sensitive protein RarD [Mesobacillus foraminis]
MNNNSEQQKGVIYAAFSYILWGILPIYWKFLDHVGAEEILANRVLWSFVFMLLVLLLTNKWQVFIKTIRGFTANKRQMLALSIASILISINWFLYIWAVNTGQMIEASLGYYINPLVSVLLGLIFFKEKLSQAQIFSFSLAAIGVLIMTISYGKFPFIAVTLALSFGLYGLAKKLIKVDSAVGLALETMVVTPIAAIYLLLLIINDKSTLFTVSWSTSFLLIGAGVATAVPLLYFAKGAQKIPLSMLGLLQYIAPTLTLLLGIFIYGEAFSKTHLLAFTFIWAALTIYSLSRTKLAIALEVKWRKEKSSHM